MVCALEGDLHFTSHNSKTMTISFSSEIIDQELELAELSAISGGVPAVPPIPPLVPIVVLVGAGAALLYAAKRCRPVATPFDQTSITCAPPSSSLSRCALMACTCCKT